jgi:hypothetical protein
MRERECSGKKRGERVERAEGREGGEGQRRNNVAERMERGAGRRSFKSILLSRFVSVVIDNPLARTAIEFALI